MKHRAKASHCLILAAGPQNKNRAVTDSADPRSTVPDSTSDLRFIIAKIVQVESGMIEWFDDLALGMRFRSGEVQVTNSDIKRFAAEFDPQPIHLDEAAAAKTPFKGLAASGWHTAAISMRLAVEVRPFGPHPLIGLGVEDLYFMAAVRPGDVLHIEGEVIGLTPSRTKPQGVARIKWTAYNQNGEAVYTFTPIGIVPRRPS
jgi:acyl dehydratase